MADRLSGKVAVVTGVGAGIGRACALLFAQEGARVVGCDIDGTVAKTTASIAEAEGRPLSAVVTMDLTNEDQVARLMEKTREREGRIDILVNAGAFGVFKWIEELTLSDWRTTLAGEVDLVFLACKAVWPIMKECGGGAIVNFSSANAHMALAGSPALAHCAGKGAVLAMTHQLAMEGAPHGIRANSIAPGLVATTSTSHLTSDKEIASQLAARHMLGRLGAPLDIAKAALFLASNDASWITAAELRVDGGVTHW